MEKMKIFNGKNDWFFLIFSLKIFNVFSVDFFPHGCWENSSISSIYFFTGDSTGRNLRGNISGFLCNVQRIVGLLSGNRRGWKKKVLEPCLASKIEWNVKLGRKLNVLMRGKVWWMITAYYTGRPVVSVWLWEGTVSCCAESNHCGFVPEHNE